MLKQLIRTGGLATATPATFATLEAKTEEKRPTVANVATVAVAKGEREVSAQPIRCGNCQHFQRDHINPAQGAGRCSAGENPRYPYPLKNRNCNRYAVTERSKL